MATPNDQAAKQAVLNNIKTIVRIARESENEEHAEALIIAEIGDTESPDEIASALTALTRLEALPNEEQVVRAQAEGKKPSAILEADEAPEPEVDPMPPMIEVLTTMFYTLENGTFLAVLALANSFEVSGAGVSEAIAKEKAIKRLQALSVPLAEEAESGAPVAPPRITDVQESGEAAEAPK